MVPNASPMALEPLDPIWLILLGCVVWPLSFLFITAGAKKIPAAEGRADHAERGDFRIASGVAGD